MFDFAITDFNLDLLSLGVGVAGVGVLGFLAYFNNRQSITNLTFLLFSLATILWGVSNFFEYKFDTIAATLLALRAHLFISVWHAFLFFQLCYVFPNPSVRFPRWYLLVLLPVTALTSLMTLTPFVFSGIKVLAPVGQVTNPERGFGLVIFSFVAFGLLFAGLVTLAHKVYRARGVLWSQTLYIFLGMFCTALLIVAFNLVLPIAFQDLTYIPYAVLFMIPFIGLTSYTIYHDRLFNVKVFATASLVVLLAALVFIEVIFTTSSVLLWVRVMIFVLVLAAGIMLIRSVMREVEQREEIEILAQNLKQANEKLKELDKLKSQFLSIASHDLRAPLTAIRNFVSLLLDGTYGKLPPAASEGMQQVFDRATGMAQSIETYLNVSRIEQGRMQYNFDKADLVKLLADTVQLFKPAADKKQLALKYHGPSDLKPIMVKADIGKLQEVFNNLIDNAIKYTPTGSITVTLENLGKMARVQFKDTGGGMDRETIDNKLFKLFSTAEDSLKQNAQSTGVGLYITKAHVVAHGGTIRAESEGKGKGSTFIVEFPIL